MKVSGCVCLLALLCVLGCTRSTAPPKDLSTVRLRVRVGGRTGYIDGTGKLVINPQFGSASEFSEGLAVVCVGDCDFGREGQGSHKYGFINESGKIVINPQFDQVREFAEGLAAFC